MLPTFPELTLAALLGEISLEGKSICITANDPDNNPFGYTVCTVERCLLLAHGVDWDLGSFAGRGTSPGSAHCSYPPAASASAEEQIAPIGFEARHAYSRRHLEALQDLSRSRIDSPQIAFVTLPGAVPEVSVNPGDPGDETAGLDSAKNCPRLGIDLMDLPLLMLPHPERPFGPREPRVTTAGGSGNRGQHTAGRRIDLLDEPLGNLKQVPAVEGRSCVRGDINRAQHLSTRRIEGAQLFSGSKPDLQTVIGHPSHPVDTEKGSILANDFSR